MTIPIKRLLTWHISSLCPWCQLRLFCPILEWGFLCEPSLSNGGTGIILKKHVKHSRFLVTLKTSTHQQTWTLPRHCLMKKIQNATDPKTCGIQFVFSVKDVSAIHLGSWMVKELPNRLLIDQILGFLPTSWSWSFKAGQLGVLGLLGNESQLLKWRLSLCRSQETILYHLKGENVLCASSFFFISAKWTNVSAWSLVEKNQYI